MDDVQELFSYAWSRHAARMAGLSDDEWVWRPTADPDLCLRWRLDHLLDVLAQGRNARWLGAAAAPFDLRRATSAADALDRGQAAYDHWAGVLAAADLTAPVGTGPYAEATRLGFALHVADELVHHSAEAALLRDLYADHDRHRGA